MAARSTRVRLENRTGHPFNLQLVTAGLSHGIWVTEPPTIIGDYGLWESESSGLFTGTEGHATYQIETVDGDVLGSLSLSWDNPYVGSNSYASTPVPQAQYGSTDGFSSGHVHGEGDNASVTFVLLAGSCQVDATTGEVVCTVSEGLTPPKPARQHVTLFPREATEATTVRRIIDPRP